VHHLDAVFRHADYVRPGVECEIAVRLGDDLEPDAAPFERGAVEAAVESVMAAIEIVDDRYRHWPSLGLPTLIADDFFASACVLGGERLEWREVDLASVSARMTVNGVEVGSGLGADILGDPLSALVWLADRCARNGHSLRAGDIVLLGSVVQTYWVDRADEVVVENIPFGDVSARFE
jgi:2-keto-4-pentenoate hydratase